MDEEKVIQLTVEGQEMIFKKSTQGVFYRPANEYGEWRTGIPEGTVWSDVQAMFDDSSY
ncbi:MAG: hypothetical protein NPIRA05_22590 [Nitrospirales bacterium]|nr:MAG: hypothetical protein NPIRA05_22590 [Nitrospirales bacterium]